MLSLGIFHLYHLYHVGKYACHSDNIVVLFLSKFIDKLIKIQQRERIIGQEMILRGHLFLQAGLYLRDSNQIKMYPRDGNGIFFPIRES